MLLLSPKLNALINSQKYEPNFILGISQQQLITLISDTNDILHQYKTIRTLLTNKEKKWRVEIYLTALFLAELLEHIHVHSIIFHHDIPLLQKQKAHYKKRLIDFGYIIDQTASPKFTPPFSWVHLIREQYPFINWLRLCLVRFKKVLNSITLIAKELTQYKALIDTIEPYINPFFIYLSWVFFLPRLLGNFYALGKHVLPGWWMSESEKQLGWYLRLTLQIKLNWFEFANDLPWCVAGILGCFVLTGTLSPIGLYLTLGLFAYDIVLAGVRASINLIDLYVLREQYEHNILLQVENPHEAELNDAYIASINQHIHYQQWRGILNVSNTVLLFLALSLTIPAIMALNPIIPLISAILILTITIAVYCIGNWLEKYAPPVEALPEEPQEKEKSQRGRWGLFYTTAKNTTFDSDDDKHRFNQLSVAK